MRAISHPLAVVLAGRRRPQRPAPQVQGSSHRPPAWLRPVPSALALAVTAVVAASLSAPAGATTAGGPAQRVAAEQGATADNEVAPFPEAPVAAFSTWDRVHQQGGIQVLDAAGASTKVLSSNTLAPHDIALLDHNAIAFVAARTSDTQRGMYLLQDGATAPFLLYEFSYDWPDSVARYRDGVLLFTRRTPDGPQLFELEFETRTAATARASQVTLPPAVRQPLPECLQPGLSRLLIEDVSPEQEVAIRWDVNSDHVQESQVFVLDSSLASVRRHIEGAHRVENTRFGPGDQVTASVDGQVVAADADDGPLQPVEAGAAPSWDENANLVYFSPDGNTVTEAEYTSGQARGADRQSVDPREVDHTYSSEQAGGSTLAQVVVERDVGLMRVDDAGEQLSFLERGVWVVAVDGVAQ